MYDIFTFANIWYVSSFYLANLMGVVVSYFDFNIYFLDD